MTNDNIILPFRNVLESMCDHTPCSECLRTCSVHQELPQDILDF
ncbi:hypothetical protein PBCV1_a086cL [Paramecium bursaria Chlorella virus 1]|uniref:Uncharacterized protein n=1 Tax=Paramecium bursaria Chlorella virus 1 TaxID=10506 RepID=F8TTX5_PBCV1|nr:hypothetical protein PBCV1_a086cL [Paramecium bursaria Chlorella virus 1]AEI70036.1 hypothetical protein [Paramecium bursaria Chlorella virus 1]